MNLSVSRAVLLLGAAISFASPARAQCQIFEESGFLEDRFGSDVDLHSGRMIVGASGDHSAAIYRRDGNDWTLEQSLTSSFATLNSSFGASVALGPFDAFVGVPNADSTGLVVWYKLVGTTWVEQVGDELRPSGSPGGAEFGFDVAYDGNRLVVGAPEEVFDGAAYAFARPALGDAWTEEARFESTSPSAKAFGRAVAVSGNWAMVGDPFQSSGGFLGGQVYFYRRQSPGNWVFEDVVSETGQLGYSMDAEADRLIVGSPRFPLGINTSAGLVRTYRRTGGEYLEEWVILPNSQELGGRFGESVGVFEDTAIIGTGTSSEINTSRALIYEFDELNLWTFSSIVHQTDQTDNPVRKVSIDEANVAVAYPEFDGNFASDADLGQVFGFALSAPGLCGDPGTISMGDGGAQTLYMDAGADFALRVYLLMGTLSGTAPGFDVGPVHVPLNPFIPGTTTTDVLFAASVYSPNSAPYALNLGLLDDDGRAVATFTVPSDPTSSLIGLTAHHAFVALDASGAVAEYASNPIELTFVN